MGLAFISHRESGKSSFICFSRLPTLVGMYRSVGWRKVRDGGGVGVGGGGSEDFDGGVGGVDGGDGDHDNDDDDDIDLYAFAVSGSSWSHVMMCTWAGNAKKPNLEPQPSWYKPST